MYFRINVRLLDSVFKGDTVEETVYYRSNSRGLKRYYYVFFSVFSLNEVTRLLTS